MTKIQWTNKTWNPVTGCNKISAGCANCYAERKAFRLKKMNTRGYQNGFEVTLQHYRLNQPKTWKKPCKIFVCSMSDLFHSRVPDDYIERVFQVMNDSPQHTFQVLTKRTQRLKEIASKLQWTPNIWLGVSVENNNYFYRIVDLHRIPAKIKFVSFEPLIDLQIRNNHLAQYAEFNKLDWIIVGGETGPKARPMKSFWVDDIFTLCQLQNIPFFFKQWTTKQKPNLMMPTEPDIVYQECTVCAQTIYPDKYIM